MIVQNAEIVGWRMGPLSDHEDNRQNDEISTTVAGERSRILAFIRSRLPGHQEAEDILHDAFYELVVAHRLRKPIGHVSGWLFKVVRNRMADVLRKRKKGVERSAEQPNEEDRFLNELQPAGDNSPEAGLARALLADALELALGELPDEQREVFLAHECDGRSFKEISASTGVPLNTLLSRKRYAVLSLRRSLRHMIED